MGSRAGKPEVRWVWQGSSSGPSSREQEQVTQGWGTDGVQAEGQVWEQGACILVVPLVHVPRGAHPPCAHIPHVHTPPWCTHPHGAHIPHRHTPLWYIPSMVHTLHGAHTPCTHKSHVPTNPMVHTTNVHTSLWCTYPMVHSLPHGTHSSHGAHPQSRADSL